MTRGGWIGFVGVVAVLVVAGGAVGIAATAQAGSAPPAAASAATTYDLGLLGQARSAADALPSGFDATAVGDGGVAASSVRLLQSGTAGGFWAALDAHGRLCLVAVLPGASAVHGSACTAADRFAAHGLSLRVAGGGAAAEAYLFPDAVSGDVLKAALPEGAVISGYGNLLLVAPSASVAARTSLTRATAPVYDLGVLPAAG